MPGPRRPALRRHHRQHQYRELTGLGSLKATVELQDLVARETPPAGRNAKVGPLQARPAIQPGCRPPRGPAHADRPKRRDPSRSRHLRLRAELAHRTGLSDQTVCRWLTLLRHEGQIEAIEKSTASKNTKYPTDRRTAHHRVDADRSTLG